MTGPGQRPLSAQRLDAAIICRSMILASSHLNGCCTAQSARGLMHTTRQERTAVWNRLRSIRCPVSDGNAGERPWNE